MSSGLRAPLRLPVLLLTLIACVASGAVDVGADRSPGGGRRVRYTHFGGWTNHPHQMRASGSTITARSMVTARSTITARSTATARSTVTARPTITAKESVVGGTSASIAGFPFLVALYDPRTGSPAAGFFCGGVIVDSIHVVTAAHCIVEAPGRSLPADRIAVLAGSTTLAPLQPGSVTDSVQASSFDARYDPSTSDYDVGLLRLARPLWPGQVPPSVNGVSRIAPLAPDPALAAGHGNPNVTPPVVVTASGWGDLNPAPADRPSYPMSLHAVRMPLVSDGLCEAQYSTIEQPITPRMICAGGGRTRMDTCYGDSGGPLLADSQAPAHPPYDYVLVGLVDFGNGCAQSGYAGVYTRISSPEVMRFLSSGVSRAPRSVAARTRHKKKRHKRHL
jgi:secreted trypsin-like serine protease